MRKSNVNLFQILIVSLVLMPFTIYAQQHNVHYTISVIAEKMQIMLKRDKKPIMEVDSIQFDFITPSSMNVVHQSAEKTDWSFFIRTSGKERRSMFRTIRLWM